MSPEPASTTTVWIGTPYARARSSSESAIAGLVCSPSSAGTCVRLRRSASATQDSDTNSCALTGQWNGVLLVGSSARYSALTTTWQVPIVPNVPEYCAATPTDSVPFLGNPVSSSTRMPAVGGWMASRCLTRASSRANVSQQAGRNRLSSASGYVSELTQPSRSVERAAHVPLPHFLPQNLHIH